MPGVFLVDAWALSDTAKPGPTLARLDAGAPKAPLGAGVAIDTSEIMLGVVRRGVPNGIEIPAGRSHQFLIQGTWGKSIPAELWGHMGQRR